MSKYSVGQKFIIEIDSHMTNKHGELYGIKGFSTLVFDDFRLDHLKVFDADAKANADYNAGYEDGLRDAWGCAKKAVHDVNIYEAFGTAILKRVWDMNPSEAVAKLKEYEAKQAEIKVGDEVVNSGDKGIVTCNNRDTCDVIWFDGSVNEELEKKFLRKTGRHYDIKSILEQLKGADDES